MITKSLKYVLGRIVSAPPVVLSRTTVPLLWLNVPPSWVKTPKTFMVADVEVNVPDEMVRSP